jgi:hypothetical protein
VERRSSLVVSKRRKDAIERLAVIVARADEEIPTEDLTLYKAGEAENKYFISASLMKGLRPDLAAVGGDDGGNANARGTTEQV